MRNPIVEGLSSDLKVLVTTDEPSPVSFSVTTREGANTYTAIHGSVTEIKISSEKYEVLPSFAVQERVKQIVVQAEADKSISVYGLNDKVFTTDVFLALSCDAMTISGVFTRYEYIILSGQFGGHEAINSEYLIVPCEDMTTLEIFSTQKITFNFGRGTQQIFADESGSVVLQTVGTYLISHRDDLTGSIVRSNKPISVFAGHECAQFPSTLTACDHLVEQIPPHTTWGTIYFLSPLAARKSGDIYRVATIYDNNQVTVTCVDEGSSTTETILSTSLSRRGWEQFNASNVQDPCSNFIPKYCCLEATKPVLVAHYSQGYTVDTQCTNTIGTELGDPSMILVPPVVQYLNNLTFSAIEGLTGVFPTRYINIAVHKMFFQPDKIFLDDELVESNRNQWNPFYCSNGEICGYGLSKAITAGNHTIYHEMEKAALGVSAYGFQQQNAYGFPVGMELQPLSGAYISARFIFTLT